MKYLLINTELSANLYIATVVMLPKDTRPTIIVQATGQHDVIMAHKESWQEKLCTVFMLDVNQNPWETLADIPGDPLHGVTPENTTVLHSLYSPKVRLEVLACPSQLEGGLINVILRLATNAGTALVLDSKDVPRLESVEKQIRKWEIEYDMGKEFNRNVQPSLPPISSHFLFYTPFSIQETDNYV